MFRPTVASVLSIFSKLILKLEGIQARQTELMIKKQAKIVKLQQGVSLATEEHRAAELAIARLKALTGEDDGEGQESV